MRILIYASNMKLDGNSGNNIHQREVAINLAKEGHEVMVISMLRDKHYSCPGVKIKAIRFFTIFPAIEGLILGIISLLALKPHILYKRAEEGYGSDYILFKLYRGRKVTEVNGILGEELRLVEEAEMKAKWTPARLLKKLHRWLLRRLTIFSFKFSIKQADVVICLTPQIKKYIEEKYGVGSEKTISMSVGANIELFKPMDSLKAKAELGLDKDSQYVCFVGTLAPWQGVEYLIQSAPLVLKGVKSARFLIVGGGSMADSYIRLSHQIGVADRFLFLGQVQYERVPLYINASDVCIVYRKPMKSGTAPLKLYEYMACEKPVVAARVEGYEILEEFQAGRLVSPEDSVELAHGIVELLKNEDLRRQMGRNGRRCVEANYSWESIAKKVAKVCNEAITLEV